MSGDSMKIIMLFVMMTISATSFANEYSCTKNDVYLKTEKVAEAIFESYNIESQNLVRHDNQEEIVTDKYSTIYRILYSSDKDWLEITYTDVKGYRCAFKNARTGKW